LASLSFFKIGLISAVSVLGKLWLSFGKQVFERFVFSRSKLAFGYLPFWQALILVFAKE
jgi:hypothetical protein